MRRSPPKTRKAHRFTSNANFFNFLGSKTTHKPSDEVAKGLKNVSNFKKLSEHSKLDKHQRMMSHLNAENKAHEYLKSVGQSAKSLPAKGLELENRLLKEELAEIKKRDEMRTRMLTEDLKAFEEKYQEFNLIHDKERFEGKYTSLNPNTVFDHEQHTSMANLTKLAYCSVLIKHLKLLLGPSPEEVCINIIEDEQLRQSKFHNELYSMNNNDFFEYKYPKAHKHYLKYPKGLGFENHYPGKKFHPYKIPYIGRFPIYSENYEKEVSRDEFINSLRTPTNSVKEEVDLCLDSLKMNLAYKTLSFFHDLKD